MSVGTNENFNGNKKNILESENMQKFAKETVKNNMQNNYVQPQIQTQREWEDYAESKKVKDLYEISEEKIEQAIKMPDTVRNYKSFIEQNSEESVQEIVSGVNSNTPKSNISQEQENIQIKQEESQYEQVQNTYNVNPTVKSEVQHTQDKKDYRLEKMLFDRINKMQGKIKESLELIKKFEKINAKEENLPNIVTTLHDKLTYEVIKQFRTVGIEFNMKSFLVQSVVSDLLKKFEEGITEFKECSENLNFVREVQEDFETKVEIAPTSKVKNFFARLRGMFKPEKKQEELERLERERQEKKLDEANIHLIKYKFINDELEKYTIKNDIIDSLTKEILYGQSRGGANNLINFISKEISREMSLLGLGNLIGSLTDNLYYEYKQRCEDIKQEEFYFLTVDEIRRNIKAKKVDSIRRKINNVVSVNSGRIAENEGGGTIV